MAIVHNELEAQRVHAQPSTVIMVILSHAHAAQLIYLPGM
jgi:hypothetical protein